MDNNRAQHISTPCGAKYRRHVKLELARLIDMLEPVHEDAEIWMSMNMANLQNRDVVDRLKLAEECRSEG